MKRQKKLIIKNRDMLDKIANALLEKESLNASEIYNMLGLEQPRFKGEDELYNNGNDYKISEYKDNDIDLNNLKIQNMVSLYSLV